MRQFSATMPAEIAAKTSELLGDFTKYIDSDMQSIHGKSAYELAKSNGYVGTEAEWVASLKGDSAYQVAKDSGFSGTQSEWLQSLTAYGVAKDNGYTGTLSEWLESLKAAGEWATLDERTKMIAENTDKTFLHNTHFRGKNLGTFTDDMAAAIKAGTFDDMWLGDYFSVPGIGNMWIAHFDYFFQQHGSLSAAFMPGLNRHNVTLLRQPPLGYTANPIWSSGQEKTAYIDSNYYTEIRPGLLEKIQAFFGEDHIMPTYDLSYTCDSNGKYTGWTGFPGMCEVETFWQRTGRQNPYQSSTYENCNGQFALYRLSGPKPIWYNTIMQVRDLSGIDGWPVTCNCNGVFGGYWGNWPYRIYTTIY